MSFRPLELVHLSRQPLFLAKKLFLSKEESSLDNMFDPINAFYAGLH